MAISFWKDFKGLVASYSQYVFTTSDANNFTEFNKTNILKNKNNCLPKIKKQCNWKEVFLILSWKGKKKTNQKVVLYQFHLEACLLILDLQI